MLQLHILSSGGDESWTELEGRECIVGRAPDAHITLANPNISRQHARVFVKNSECWLEDLGSSNGVVMNGEKIHESTLLKPGDQFRIDSFTLRLVERGTNQQDCALIGLSAPCEGQIYTLYSDQITVGRDTSCNVVINDDSISRQHGAIIIHRDHVEIRDLDSSNGILINKEKIKNAEVKDGDIVQFGGVGFKFRLGSRESGSQLIEEGIRSLFRTSSERELRVYSLIMVGIALLLNVITGVTFFGQHSSSPTSDTLANANTSEHAALANARQKMNIRSWQEARDIYSAVLEKDPLNSEARKNIRRAANNARAEEILEQGQDAVSGNRHETVLAEIEHLKLRSDYGTRLEPFKVEYLTRSLKMGIARANKACAAKKWKRCHREAAFVLMYNPDYRPAKNLLKWAEEEMDDRGMRFTPWKNFR
jgi:ABC transport system ATP-binding/permease protein